MSSTMKAITVTEWGQTPCFAPDAPLPPAPENNQVQIRVLASALPNLVRSMAAGTHYSVNKDLLPYIPGVDGVGLTIPDNKLVYFSLMGAKSGPGGALAEYVTVDKIAIAPVPVPDGASDQIKQDLAAKVAVLMNPALSSWMALSRRARIDEYAETGKQWNVLIIGATSTAGRIAALQARYLGASQIIGAARGAEQLEALKSQGVIDIAVPLNRDDVSKTDFSFFKDTFPHVILDYVYGHTASVVLQSIPHTARSAELAEARYVHIGTLGQEATIALDGAFLRSTNITINGAGPGSWSLPALAKATPDIIKAIINLVQSERWEEAYGVTRRGLQDVFTAWADTKARSVFVMDGN